PLRRPGVCVAIGVALLAVLSIAASLQLGLIRAMRPDIASVFFRALCLSSLLATVPVAMLWFLDRRERETPWLFAVTFFWGACIATGLALPFNTAFARIVDAWVTKNPMIEQVLGPDAGSMLAAPISAPIVEELTKALGVLAVFWLLRAEFDNMRDGFVYGALVGLGFTWFEAPLYVAQGYAEFGVAPWGMQLGWRYALFGFSGHAMFTGIFGALLGLVFQTRRRWLRMLAPNCPNAPPRIGGAGERATRAGVPQATGPRRRRGPRARPARRRLARGDPAAARGGVIGVSACIDF